VNKDYAKLLGLLAAASVKSLKEVVMSSQFLMLNLAHRLLSHQPSMV
jgi:hypothetical protein